MLNLENMACPLLFTITDEIIIEIAKTTLSGKIDPQYIDALSHHGYTFTNQINIRNLAQTLP